MLIVLVYNFYSSEVKITISGTKVIYYILRITAELVIKIKDELKRLGIEHSHAPYEADAQLTFLNKINK